MIDGSGVISCASETTMAHSLGNMLVSSAIQDWNLPHDTYMLLNAAVPIEAYDTSSDAVNETTVNRMLPREWVGYDDSLKAVNWHMLFDVGDGRRKLTWKGRFSRVVNVVNYYSSEEEVLRCGNGEWRQPLQRAYSWYKQERIKGVKPFELGLGRNEGGWGFNSDYEVEDEYENDDGQTVTYMRRRNAEEMRSLLEDDLIDLKSEPFFGWVENRTICTNMYLAESAVSRDLQSQLLADAIPAESLPAGANAVPNWSLDESTRDIDMSVEFKDVLMKEVVFPGGDNGQWGHSFFLGVPYMIVHGLFDNIIYQISEGGSDE